MSQDAIAQVLERASTDAAFRAQLAKKDANALAGYDLTAEERAALMSGDPTSLAELGVDSRISKISGGSWFDSEGGGSFGSGG
jgi:hypothetical protein